MKKKKLLMIIVISTFFLFVPSVAAEELIKCGSISEGVPAKIVSFVNLAVKLVKYLVPVIIILVGSLDFFKASVGSDNDMLAKTLKVFGKKLIAGAMVFLIVTIFQVAVSLVAKDGSTMQCVSCFISNKGCGEVYTDEDSDVKTGTPVEGVENNKGYTDPSNNGTDPSNNGGNTTNNSNMFIGDSRTEGMCSATSSCGNSAYVAKVGAGYSWFEGTAISSANSKMSSGQNYNVIILMGVNDVGGTTTTGENAANKYYSKVQNLANTNWKSHKVIFVSVNPVQDGKSSAYSAAVNQFNKVIEAKIKASGLSNLTYCNTNSNIKVGQYYSMGLHYDGGTYTNIYNYITNNCLK